MDLIGLLFMGFIAIAIFAWILILMLRATARGVAKVGGKVGAKTGEFVAGAGTLIAEEMTGKKYNWKKNMDIGKKIGKSVGSAAGAVGTVVLGGEIAGLGDSESVNLDDGGNKIDINNDRIIDGYDSNNDGIIDRNINGVPINGLEDVKGYTKADGTQVSGYQRTIADGIDSNNLRPKGFPRWKWNKLQND